MYKYQFPKYVGGEGVSPVREGCVSKIVEEAMEYRDKFNELSGNSDVDNQIEACSELLDTIHACETELRQYPQDVQEMAYRHVIVKNDDRGYYGEDFDIRLLGNTLLQDMSDTFEKCLSIAEAKNADYSGEKDPMFNFNIVKFLDIAEVHQGLLTRITDKYLRLINLTKRKARVKDESIDDTINDMINYLAILKYALKEKRDEL